MNFTYATAAAVLLSVHALAGCAADHDDVAGDESADKLDGFVAPGMSVVLNGDDASKLIDSLVHAGLEPIHGFAGDILDIDGIDCSRYGGDTTESYTYRCRLDARGALVGSAGNADLVVDGDAAEALTDLLDKKVGIRPHHQPIFCITAPCPESTTMVWSTGKVGCRWSFIEKLPTSCSVGLENE